MSEKPFGVIYKATNIVNGKCYIGQTTNDPVKYWIKHLKNAFKSENPRKIFYRAIQKYGPENFIWEVLEFCNSKEELNEMEFHYIKQFNSLGNDKGYNATFGGYGTYGATWKKTKEQIEKMSGENHWTNFKDFSYETRKQMSISAKNRPPVSEETRRKQSVASKGRIYDENFRKKARENMLGEKNHRYGKKESKETKEKRINSLRRIWKIEYPSGKIEITKNLKEWLKENNFKDKRKPIRKGYKFFKLGKDYVINNT